MSILSVRIEVDHVTDGLGKLATVNAALWIRLGRSRRILLMHAVFHIGFLQFADGAGDERGLGLFRSERSGSQ